MKKHFLPLFTIFVALAVSLPAKDTIKAAPYFPAAAIDVKKLLGDPPALDSAEGKKEIADILAMQAARTDEQIARIKNESHFSVYLLGNVVGPWFTKENAGRTPALTALFERVDATANPIVTVGKDSWKRPRPFLEDARIIPPIDRPGEFAYPSGHATRGLLDALVFAQLMPEKKDALLARGIEIGDDRVMGGVHHPSDVASGRKLGQAIFDLLTKNAAFEADLAKAKTEIAAEQKSAK